MQPKILVVDDDQGARDALQVILEDDYSVTLAASGQEALSLCMQASFDVVFLDVTMPELDGIEVLKRLKSMDDSMDVVMISASDKAQKAVQSIKLGAYDYITKPFEPDEILSAVSRVLEKRNLQRENRYLRSEVAYAFSHNEIITQNSAVARILELVRKVAPTTSSILIAGESGTGKELVARCLHRWSNRRDGPFVAINCAAIPGELMESELFGHERGAFTGAHNRSIGKFEYADGGTLFLDEIAALRLDLQAKLLRVIQEKEINRLGSNRNIKVDVRIVAASNTDLEKSIRNGTFRQDLYFRLNVIPIKLPPLRERLGDVPILAQHFVAKFNKQVKRQVLGFTPRALEALERYPWPGNIRELENLVERLVVLGRDNEPIAYEDLPLELILDSVAPPETTSGERNGLLQARENFERQYIIRALKRAGWNQSEAARILKIHRNTLL
ncbi:MAG: sigma-54-dependent Fis family transcriptional regulator, partial [Deltaproteobacteria bacterium]|nr:sigma-54-dependent Fis family transcriptional regulator [Deltaproteobacteria bacterium]